LAMGHLDPVEKLICLYARQDLSKAFFSKPCWHTLNGILEEID